MRRFKLFDSLEEAKRRLSMNKPIKVSAAEFKISLVRTPQGIFAIADECTHLGESLSKGTVNHLGEIVCPWHSYRFNLKSGEECQRRSPKAKTFKIQAEEKGVYLAVE